MPVTPRSRLSRSVVLAMALAVGLSGPPSLGDVSLTSPDGQVTAMISISPTNRLQYRMWRGGLTVLEESPLGLLIDWIDLGTNVTSISATPPVQIAETYRHRGVKAWAQNHYNEISLQVTRTGTGDAGFTMTWRAFNDGIAWCYQIPGSGDRPVCGESSSWTVPAGTVAWSHYGVGFHEEVFRPFAVGNTTLYGLMPPATCKMPDTSGVAPGYLTITEAQLTNYMGMRLNTTGTSRTIRTTHTPEGYGWCWPVPGGSNTPWRVAITAPDLNQLVNSTMVHNLNPAPAPALADAEWIKPGRSVWSWWAKGVNYSDQTTYIDAAVNLGFEYTLWDEGWEGWSTSQLDSLLQYARNRNIGVWLWKKYVAMNTYEKRAAFFNFIDAKNAALGKKVIVGAKLDFMNSEEQPVIAWYPAVLQEAADRQLMLNFHGSNKPTGYDRTWPNEMTREGIRGLEYHIWGEYLPPSHNAVLPFTRLIPGHADYTPVTFDPNRLGSTTFGQQLAMAFVLTSPLTHWPDIPSRYISSVAVDVIRAAPTVWDETIVLPPSELGDLALMARRKGHRWFVAGVNGTANGRTVDVDLSFLSRTHHDSVLLSDSTSTPAALVRTTSTVTCTDTLSVWMRGGGGFVAMLTDTFTGLTTVRADFDNDGDVDQDDFGFLQTCLGGQFDPPTPECVRADLDRENTVTQQDVSMFMDCFSGPSVPVDLDCMP